LKGDRIGFSRYVQRQKTWLWCGVCCVTTCSLFSRFDRKGLWRTERRRDGRIAVAYYWISSSKVPVAATNMLHNTELITVHKCNTNMKY